MNLLLKILFTHYTINAMKKFVIQEKFTGYAEVTIEADTEQEAIDLYNEGSYDDDVYIKDDMYYDFQFDSIKEAD